MTGKISYLNGHFVEHKDANVSIASHVVNYGTGCFEGIRAYFNPEHGELYATLLAEHAERLVRSAHILGLEAGLDAVQIADVVLELLRRNDVRHDAYVRPLIFKSEESITVKLSGLSTSFGAYYQEMGEYLDVDAGLSVCFSPWRRIDDNSLPSRAKVIGSYVNAALASDGARRGGFDEALMLTADGHVAEAASSNIFLVFDGSLHTPSATDDILVGVTRAAVMELASERGIKVHERQIDRSESFVADEAFLCGTGVQIAPVTAIDRRQIGDGKPGPLTLLLQVSYLKAVRGEDTTHEAWRTPVHGPVQPHGRPGA